VTAIALAAAIAASVAGAELKSPRWELELTPHGFIIWFRFDPPAGLQDRDGDVRVSNRPMILGMNNPLSDAPEHALYPLPAGCTGSRLFGILKLVWPEIGFRDYLRSYERRNLVVGQAWSAVAGRIAADVLREEIAKRRSVQQIAVLGAQTWAAIHGHRDDTPVLASLRVSNIVWNRLPHPSGRNPWYNVEENRLAAARLLLSLLTPLPETT
jgi:hypothetical protein